MRTIVLASSSPRRRELLESCGIPFQVVRPEVSESVGPEVSGSGARAVVSALALRKALAVRRKLLGGPGGADDDSWVLGADTVVVLDAELLGQPADEGDARRMLLSLSGRVHRVHTGLALIPGNRSHPDVRVASAEVRFRALGSREVEWYLASGEWRGAAGAYRVQERGGFLVQTVCGSYSAVVGLPLETFYGMLLAHRYDFIGEG